ncbi:type I restriction enzyme S subunit [Salinibacter ruber]|uniref:restriction endonuclease subunit S n=1 Tax=Salinibacter ruber TaxID=146919 RepID=UPI00160971F3|nr:restriction endonuclease subunit S [Salinibacter ruber]MBB4070622.1 type I restriction enzyme S subunit [Salinibacter ruber]
MSDDFEMEVVESPSLEDGSSDEGTGQPSPSGDSSSSFLVGALPDEWDAHRLDDICQVNPESFSQDSHEADEFEYISLSDATDGVVTNTESVPVEEAPSRATRKVREGDVLVGTVRPKQSSHGFATEEHDGKVCSSGFGVLRTDGHVNSQYLRQEVLSHRFFRQMMAYVAGSGYPAVKLSDLEKHRIALPSLPEQRKIASVLYAVDQAIQKTEAIIEQAKRVKRGLLQDLFSFGVGSDDRLRDPDQNPGSFRETKLGSLPSDWEVIPMGKAISTLYRYPSYYDIEYVDKGVPEVRGELLRPDGTINLSTEEIRYVSEETASEYPRVRLEENDFVISVRGTVGKVGRIPPSLAGGVITANLIRVKFDTDLILPDYAQVMLLSRQFQRRLDALTSATTIKTIKADDLRRIPVRLPNFSEQQRISKVVQSRTEKVRKEQAQLDELLRLKKGLMQNLLTGEVRTMNKAIEVLGEVKAHG